MIHEVGCSRIGPFDNLFGSLLLWTTVSAYLEGGDVMIGSVLVTWTNGVCACGLVGVS